MKKTAIILLIIYILVVCASCGNTADKDSAGNSSNPSQSPAASASSNPSGNPSNSPNPSEKPMTDAEKLAEEYKKIAEEALNNEHDHVWVFSHYEDEHPHIAVYKCECGAVFYNSTEGAPYEMTNVGISKEHPHYVLQECSYCKKRFPNSSLPTPLTWVLDGYTAEHPHYGKVKCSQCDYYEINQAITAEGNGVSQLVVDGYEKEHPHRPIIKCTYPGCDHSYIEKNSTSVDTGYSKLIVSGYTDDHPHYAIVKCTFEGCDHTYIEKNLTAEWELETDSDNYGLAHPHFIYGACSHDGCAHTEKTNMIADWEWKDGVCSICGRAKNVVYTDTGEGKMVTGTVEPGYEGHLGIPSYIEFKPVEIIGAGAFHGNSLITSVSIPDTVRIIEAHAFEDCISIQLDSMEICPFCKIEPGLREEPECPLCGMFEGNPLSGHPVGNIGVGVEIIGQSAFMNCTSLESVHFGEHIHEIMDFAFAGCMNLKRISFSAMVAPNIFPGTFEGLSPETRIFIPVGAVGYEGPEWDMFEMVFYE